MDPGSNIPSAFVHSESEYVELKTDIQTHKKIKNKIKKNKLT
jgi:hypothetical protein